MPETKAKPFADSESDFFETVLDIVNPLQHIPVVSTIYRAITGDQIAAPARLIGGALFGGPLGFASTVGNLMLEDATGNDLAGHALALVGDLADAPELAQAAAPVAAVSEPAPQAAANLAAAGAGAEIIWNSPRVLPSLARAEAAQISAADNTTVDLANVDAPVGDIVPVAFNDRPLALTSPGAAAPQPGPRPAWLEAAITDAQTVHNATQNGKATQKVAAQPWVTDAMLDALGKYETLARERSQ